MKKISILVLILTVQALADVKPSMVEFYKITAAIQPYIVSKKSYTDQKNEKEISKNLKEFVNTVTELKKEKMMKSDDMKFRVQQLSDNLAEAELTFKNGFKDYSYWVLKSSFSNCFACHTQKSLGETHYTDGSVNLDLYPKTEFLFLIRNYSAAKPLIEKIIAEYPENKISTEELEAMILKNLYYLIRVQKDDIASLKSLEKILENTKLPSEMRQNILAWKKYLTVKKYRINNEFKITTVRNLQKFLDQRALIANEFRLSHQRYIVDLETSQTLFELIENNPPVDLRPHLLYSLADHEKDYRENMFDLSSENYLKECIQKYPKTPAAQKCFALYKEMQTLSFTGSRGTDIPADVQKQLDEYESLIRK